MQCIGLTEKGPQCSRGATHGNLCWQHDKMLREGRLRGTISDSCVSYSSDESECTGSSASDISNTSSDTTNSSSARKTRVAVAAPELRNAIRHEPTQAQPDRTRLPDRSSVGTRDIPIPRPQHQDSSHVPSTPSNINPHLSDPTPAQTKARTSGGERKTTLSSAQVRGSNVDDATMGDTKKELFPDLRTTEQSSRRSVELPKELCHEKVFEKASEKRLETEIRAYEILRGEPGIAEYFGSAARTPSQAVLYLRKYDHCLKDVLMNRPGDLSAATRLQIASSLCQTVCAMHSAGVIHGDLKEENVMLDSNFNPVLIDFDAAEFVWGDNAENVGGTMGYFREDALSDKSTDFANDIFALGRILASLALEPTIHKKLYPLGKKDPHKARKLHRIYDPRDPDVHIKARNDGVLPPDTSVTQYKPRPAQAQGMEQLYNIARETYKICKKFQPSPFIKHPRVSAARLARAVSNIVRSPSKLPPPPSNSLPTSLSPSTSPSSVFLYSPSNLSTMTKIYLLLAHLVTICMDDSTAAINAALKYTQNLLVLTMSAIYSCYAEAIFNAHTRVYNFITHPILTIFFRIIRSSLSLAPLKKLPATQTNFTSWASSICSLVHLFLLLLLTYYFFSAHPTVLILCLGLPSIAICLLYTRCWGAAISCALVIFTLFLLTEEGPLKAATIFSCLFYISISQSLFHNKTPSPARLRSSCPCQSRRHSKHWPS